jgi:riboflavin transporter FmnP
MNLNRPTIKLAGATLLAPLAVILQIFVPLYATPWGMQIDLVAIPWMICWIVFGLKPALLSLLISAPLVGFLGPFAGGWVGATMKSVATVWMFLIPAFFAQKAGGTKQLLENKKLLVIAGVIAIAIRAVIATVFNFYFAIPFFFGMSTEAIIGMFSNPGALSFIGQSLGTIGLGAYVVEVSFWNIIQGIIDLVATVMIALIIFRRIPSLSPDSKNQ